MIYDQQSLRRRTATGHECIVFEVTVVPCRERAVPSFLVRKVKFSVQINLLKNYEFVTDVVARAST